MTKLQHPAPAALTPALLQGLAETYATPLWVYDAETIRARAARLTMFDTVRFAQKACSNTHVLRLLRGLGVQVDAVSAGEIERALHAVAGAGVGGDLDGGRVCLVRRSRGGVRHVLAHG